jgi:hypothetical protein
MPQQPRICRREAFFACSRCSSSRWHYLSEANSCARCARPVPNQRETLRRNCADCGAAGTMTPVANIERAIGITVGWCEPCGRWSREMNASFGNTVMCRGCRHAVPPTAICSADKFVHVRRYLRLHAMHRHLREATFVTTVPPIVRNAAVHNLFTLLPPTDD